MTTFYEENSRLLTPGAFEFVLDSELKRAVRSQNYLTLVTVEASRDANDILSDVEPADDAVASAAYRRAVLPKLVREALDQLELA